MRVRIGKLLVSAGGLGITAWVMAACGGGGDSSPAPAPAPPPAASAPPPAAPPPATSGAPTFTSGVFEPASDFEDQCELVRTGRDIEGNTFPDREGSTLLENFWLRSWTNETYLWNDEVVDQDPAGFDDRLAYFEVLKTEEITASGKPKDEFHFSQPTEEFLRSRNSEPTASYGIRLVAFANTVPRDFRVLFTEPGSPASEVVLGTPNLIRGTRILEVDGVDLVNGSSQADVDALNAGLFPATAGETHTFLVQDPGSNESRSITMVSADLAPKPVNRTRIIDTPTGKVGYILFNTFSPFASEEEIATAMRTMSTEGVSDLVLDLRYNGGGLLAVAGQLGYMVAGAAQTAGKDFERLRFNATSGNTNPVTGQFNAPTPFYNTGLGFSLVDGESLPSLNLSRVFILSTDSTCSASESVINSLRGIDVEVILIGTKTCGKPFGFYPTDNCGETYFTVQFQGVNDIGFGDYADGFVASDSAEPFGIRLAGCEILDDLSNELGTTSEAMLAAALQFREDGTCPAASAPTTKPSAIAAVSGSVSGVSVSGLSIEQEEVLNSRDMRLPYSN